VISLQTNINSLQAQQNLSVNNAFQSKTIQQLSSGYRINSSADDAAGLAVANQYTSDTVELQQGVRNANDGLSQLQILDGGLSNISQILDRMKTLATQSASSTFTGNRATLNSEYQQLISEITRQSSNIQLNSGGNLNKALSVYVGGARTSSQSGSAVVNVDLSGINSAVDAASLNLNGTNVNGGGTGSTSFTGNGVTNLNDPGSLFLNGGGTETFNISYVNANGVVSPATINVNGGPGGITGAAAVTQINNQLSGTGMTAQIGSNGALQFAGGNLLSVTAATSSGSAIATNGATMLNGGDYQATSAFTPFTAGSGGPTTENLVVSLAGTNYNITLDSSSSGNTAADTVAHAVASLNSQLRGSGVYASANGNNISLQSAKNFSLVETGNAAGSAGAGTGSYIGTTPGNSIGAAAGVWALGAFTPLTGSAQETLDLALNGTHDFFTLNSTNAGTITDAANYLNLSPDLFVGVNGSDIQLMNSSYSWTMTVTSYSPGTGTAGAGSLFGSTPGDIAVTAPTNPGASSSGSTGNAQDAIAAINKAVTALGAVQGKVGAGENMLNYAVALAQSQISNFSAAQSQIRDADVAAGAANLTKAQVLQQASIAAMAQANSSPQAVLKLLQ
jgi:flagellin